MTDRTACNPPPLALEALAGTGGTLGPEPEDFQVDEIPLYSFSGEGEHLYVRIRKRRLTTRDAVAALACAADVPSAEIGTAGMKDKHAVTTQWMSLPSRRAKPIDAWSLPEGLEIVEWSRHGNKLRTGHLKGNRFRIRLVGTEPGGAGRAGAIAAALRDRGLPNYFGAQRFGRGGGNLARAIEWLEAEAGGGKTRTPPFERKLFASVVQSEVFNRYTTARLAGGLDRPIEGEVVRLEGTGSLFAVEDPERESPRWRGGDIHPTGPMIGPKMRKAHGAALRLEAVAIESLELGSDALERLGRFADGTRRDVLVRVPDIRVDPGGEGALIIDFTLPSGSYATEVLRQFSREPFFRYAP